MTTVEVYMEENVVEVHVDSVAGSLTLYRKLGSLFSGSSGASGRAITISGVEIRSNAFIFIGYRLLDAGSTPAEYSVSTVTTASDTLTIAGALFDDDVVLIWT